MYKVPRSSTPADTGRSRSGQSSNALPDLPPAAELETEAVLKLMSMIACLDTGQRFAYSAPPPTDGNSPSTGSMFASLSATLGPQEVSVMKRLSSPVEGIKPHYSVVVIGSGYGGSIAASRFARAGKDVCLLERGKEFLPGEYPDTQTDVVRETQFDVQGLQVGSEIALMDFRFNKDINVLVGCGLGGTSLINAGVTVMPDSRVFDDPVWAGAAAPGSGGV